MGRLDVLDWQRGLLAISVMFYHLSSWYITSLDSGSLLGRLGIYSVSMFFVLSGLSMALVYKSFLIDIKSSIKFFTRRIFRILPLLWLSIGLVIFVVGKSFSVEKIILNLTLSFGFIAPSEYINTGAWSIGNELVYYSLTPFIFMIFNRNVLLGNAFLIFTMLVGAWFSHYKLDPKLSLATQWNTYINPFNNFYFYVSGIAIVYNFSSFNFRQTHVLTIFFASALLLTFYPVDGNQINIATGGARVALSIASILMVLSAYKAVIELPKAINYILTSIGLATYSIYLLHPIVSEIISIKIINTHSLGNLEKVMVFSMATILLSIMVYHVIEKPCIKLGKLITQGGAVPSPARRV